MENLNTKTLIIKSLEDEMTTVHTNITYHSGLINNICQDYTTDHEIKLDITLEELKSCSYSSS
jgi:hypothetical protein